VPGAARRVLTVPSSAARTGPFRLLAGSFAICGASTNGLAQTHFVPASHDHGIPVTTAAPLPAVIGVFDVAGTIASGWSTDRYDTRRLLAVYYAPRGVSLLFLPMLLAPGAHPPMVFLIVFHGLDREGDRAAHAGAVPRALRGRRTDRLRVGARLPPGGRGRGRLRGRRDALGSYDVVRYASGRGARRRR
jgi:hypothetical protein